MKRWMCWVGLAAALYGCGGGDDDDDSSSGAGSGGAMSASGSSSEEAGASGHDSGSGGAAGIVEEQPMAGMGEAGSMEPSGPGNCTPEQAPDLSVLQNAGMLKQLSMEDGIVRSLAAYDGNLYFMEDGIGLRRVASAGGTPEVVLPFDDTAYFFIGG